MCVPQGYAEIELFNLLDEVEATLQWEPMRKIGVIVKGRDCLVFKPGFPWVIHNYNKKIAAGQITIENGALIFSETAEKIVRTIFSEAKEGRGPRIAAVLLDPGHGGRDPGTIGVHKAGDNNLKLIEKDIVLKVAKIVYKLLKLNYPDKKILLTRSDDSYPTLEERVEMANRVSLGENEAIIFLSVHANASLNKNASGFEVWYLPPEYRRTVIDKETLESEPEEIIPILNTMLEEEYTVESIILARQILDRMEEKIGNRSVNRGLKEETWYVVRNAKMPSVLVEIGFVTNREDAMLLADSGYLKELGEGIYNGVADFIEYFESTKGFTEQ